MIWGFLFLLGIPAYLVTGQASAGIMLFLGLLWVLIAAGMVSRYRFAMAARERRDFWLRK